MEDNRQPAWFKGQKVWDRTISKSPGRISQLLEPSQTTYCIRVEWEDVKDSVGEWVDRDYDITGKLNSEDAIGLLKPYYYELVETEILPEVGEIVHCWEVPNDIRCGFFVRKTPSGYLIANANNYREEELVHWSNISKEKPY